MFRGRSPLLPFRSLYFFLNHPSTIDLHQLPTSTIFDIDPDFHNYIISRIFQATVKVCYPSPCNFQYIGTLYIYSSSILKILHSSKEFDAFSNQSPIENINACSAQNFSRILKTSTKPSLEIKWKSGLFKVSDCF